jgi:hypothetical protein
MFLKILTVGDGLVPASQIDEQIDRKNAWHHFLRDRMFQCGTVDVE